MVYYDNYESKSERHREDIQEHIRSLVQNGEHDRDKLDAAVRQKYDLFGTDALYEAIDEILAGENPGGCPRRFR